MRKRLSSSVATQRPRPPETACSDLPSSIVRLTCATPLPVRAGTQRARRWSSAGSSASTLRDVPCSFIRTVTVGPGIAPGQPRLKGWLADSWRLPYTAGGEFHPALNRFHTYCNADTPLRKARCRHTVFPTWKGRALRVFRLQPRPCVFERERAVEDRRGGRGIGVGAEVSEPFELNGLTGGRVGERGLELRAL